jgi:hypothetical protein
MVTDGLRTMQGQFFFLLGAGTTIGPYYCKIDNMLSAEALLMDGAYYVFIDSDFFFFFFFDLATIHMRAAIESIHPNKNFRNFVTKFS